MATGNSTALYYLDVSHLRGAIVPGDTGGFDWFLVAVFREPATNRKEVISEVLAHTDDGDSLVVVKNKHIAAIKAEGLRRDFNVTAVVYPNFTLETGV